MWVRHDHVEPYWNGYEHKALRAIWEKCQCRLKSKNLKFLPNVIYIITSTLMSLAQCLHVFHEKFQNDVIIKVLYSHSLWITICVSIKQGNIPILLFGKSTKHQLSGPHSRSIYSGISRMGPSMWISLSWLHYTAGLMTTTSNPFCQAMA